MAACYIAIICIFELTSSKLTLCSRYCSQPKYIFHRLDAVILPNSFYAMY